MMRACFADNADLPLICNHDSGETWNCVPATEGIAKHDCPYWQPQRAIALVRTILGAGINPIVIYGEPASKANGREIVKIGGKRRSIKSTKARNYVTTARYQLNTLKLTPIGGDVFVVMKIYYASRRPDLDESVILDVLQGHAYHNDRQVKMRFVEWGLDKENPRAGITVVPL
jgi:hypothetical protein